MVLARNPLCVDPFKRHPNAAVLSTIADHIVPLHDGGGWALENGQGLCGRCHAVKTARETMSRGQGVYSIPDCF